MYKLKERLWGSLAHIPIVTIIWTSYLLFEHFSQCGTFASLFEFKIINTQMLPITPIILTLLSFPISLSIMYAQKKSHFIHDNAKQAYLFNIWLLKTYAILFICVFIGKLFSVNSLLFFCGLTISAVALLCFQQSTSGIISALQGKVFHYWYPGRKK